MIQANRDDTKMWEGATQQVQVVIPSRKDSIRRHFWSTIALIGAIVVVSLYLIVPLIVFFGIVNDLLTQLLAALLILTIGEFIVFGILLKTARSTKLDLTKTQAALINTQNNDNVPFDIIVNTQTTRIPLPQFKNLSDTETVQQASILPSEDLADAKTVQRASILPSEDLSDAEIVQQASILLSKNLADTETVKQASLARR